MKSTNSITENSRTFDGRTLICRKHTLRIFILFQMKQNKTKILTKNSFQNLICHKHTVAIHRSCARLNLYERSRNLNKELQYVIYLCDFVTVGAGALGVTGALQRTLRPDSDIMMWFSFCFNRDFGIHKHTITICEGEFPGLQREVNKHISYKNFIICRNFSV